MTRMQAAGLAVQPGNGLDRKTVPRGREGAGLGHAGQDRPQSSGENSANMLIALIETQMA